MDYLHSSNVLHGDLKVGLPHSPAPVLQYQGVCSSMKSAASRSLHMLRHTIISWACLCALMETHCSWDMALRSCACPACWGCLLLNPSCTVLQVNVLVYTQHACGARKIACLHVERPCAKSHSACVLAQECQEPCASTNYFCFAAVNQHAAVCLGNRLHLWPPAYRAVKEATHPKQI